MHQCWQLNLSAVGIGTGYYGGRFSTTIRGELAGKIETIPVSGTVTIDRRDGYGNPVEVTITLDSLPLSLDIGIPFVKSDAPIYPRTGDNGMDVGTLLAMCGLSLALGGASLGTLRLARKKAPRKLISNTNNKATGETAMSGFSCGVTYKMKKRTPQLSLRCSSGGELWRRCMNTRGRAAIPFRNSVTTR